MASVTDYADSYVTLRFSGSGVRDLLCRLLPVDVHPRAFGIGCLAVTEAARIGATVWRLEDEVDGAPVFEIAVVRSMAECFRHAISEAAQDQSTLSGEGERWPEHVGTNAPTPSETRT
jgi:sarcosine oxidase subunit gamma